MSSVVEPKRLVFLGLGVYLAVLVHGVSRDGNGEAFGDVYARRKSDASLSHHDSTNTDCHERVLALALADGRVELLHLREPTLAPRISVTLEHALYFFAQLGQKFRGRRRDIKKSMRDGECGSVNGGKVEKQDSLR